VTEPEQDGRYIVTVEYEVYANSTEDAVNRYLIATDRYLVVRKVKRVDADTPNPSLYKHEHTYYDEDGLPDTKAALRHAS
jgi:hypothetical protein